MKELIGTTLGKYSIVARLGHGGMAAVYKAHQPRLDRYVAIKVLHSHLSEEVNFVTRFEREAAAVARLNHPNVVRIFDFDADNGQYYMVMELIEGPSLKSEMQVRKEKGRSWAPQEIIRITLPLAEAVHYAHSCGIVHRDIKPSNVLLTTDGRVVLTDFGLAYILGGSQVTETGTTSGTPEYMSPEQAKGERGDERSDIYSLGVILYEIAAGKLPFEGETTFATLMAHINQDLVPPSRFNPDLPLPLEGIILTAMQKEPDQRYHSVEEMVRGLQGALDQRITHTPVAILAPAPKIESITETDITGVEAIRPYRGLFAFREEDAPFFFGREAFARRLDDAVRENGMVVVVGPSGSGKSSVVHAGLIPKLRQQANWIIADMRPGSQPFHALADALVALLEPDLGEVDRLVETRKLAQSLQDGTLPLADVAERALEKGSAGRMLLVVDQFEELYTLCTEAETRLRFTSVLLEAARPGNSEKPAPFVLALTLRADFMSQALSDRRFAEALQQADVKLGPMTREELTAAIEQPAIQLGATFEPGLIVRILDDVGDEPGNLPLLEFALALLWDRRAGRRLTHAAYEAIGRVEGALTRYAEKVYARLSEAERLRARRIFTQMVRPGEGTEDTRRRATRAELGEAGWTLVQQLADERLVVTGQDAAGNEMCEVIHEVLIRSWRRLREWINADRDFRAWQERLRAAAQQWQSRNQDEAALLRGSLLTEAEEWLIARRADLSEAEQAFIKASTTLREREIAEQEAQQQRELEAAQRLAREQQRRAEEQAEAARKLRTRAWFLVGAAAIALVLMVLAIGFARQSAHNAQQAEEQRQEAERGWATAREEAIRAEENAQRAEIEAQEAERQRQIALARQLAAQSTTMLNDQLDLAMLLGLESTHLYDAAETRSSLLSSLQHDPSLVTILRGHVGMVVNLSFNGDGTMLASSGTDSTARLWSIEYQPDGTPIFASHGSPFAVHTENEMTNDVALSPDGTMLATASDDMTAKIWDVETGELLGTLEGSESYIQFAFFSADGRKLYTGGGETEVRVWDVETMEQIASLPGLREAMLGFAISRDGTKIVTSDLFGQIFVWDAATDELIVGPLMSEEAVLAADFSPDGRTLATLGYNCSLIRFWDTTTGEPTGVFTVEHESYARSIAYLDNDTIFSRSYEDTRLWDISTGEEIATFDTLPAVLLNMAVSPDGRLLATNSSVGNVVISDLAGELGLGRAVDSIHEGYVRGVDVHPDGHTLAASSYDGRIATYDMDSGQLVLGPLTHYAALELTAVSSLVRDGERFIVSRADGTSTAWYPEQDEVQVLRSAHAYGPVVTVSSAANERFFSGGADGRVGLWPTGTANWGAEWTAHEGAVTSLVLSPPGNLLVSAGSDGLVDVRAFAGGDNPVFVTFEEGVQSAAFSYDEQWLAVGSPDGNVGIWHIWEEAELVRFDAAHDAAVMGLTFLPNEEEGALTLLSFGGDGSILRWDLMVADGAVVGEPSSTVLQPAQGADRITAITFYGQTVALGDGDGNVTVWDLSVPWEEPLLAVVAPDAVTALLLEEEQLLAGTTTGLVRTWDLAEPETTRDWAPDELPWVAAVRVAYSPDGTLLATTGFNGTVRIWDAETGELLRALFGHHSSTTALAFSPDGQLLATGSCAHRSAGSGCDRGELFLWDMTSGELASVIEGQSTHILGIAFSPDGATIATSSCAIQDVGGACNRGEIAQWSAATGELIRSWEGHAQAALDIDYSPDGSLLATVSADGYTILWDAATGEQVGQQLRGYGGETFTVAFSPDGRTVASGGGGTYTTQGYINGQITLWDIATGRSIGGPLVGHTTLVAEIAYNPDGTRLVSGAHDGSIIVWNTAPDAWSERACRVANRNLTLEEWAQFFGEEPHRETCSDVGE